MVAKGVAKMANITVAAHLLSAVVGGALLHILPIAREKARARTHGPKRWSKSYKTGAMAVPMDHHNYHDHKIT